MRHYVSNILIAFLILAIYTIDKQNRNEPYLNEANPKLCTFVGKEMSDEPCYNFICKFEYL